jgi:hypothetical protein
MCVPAEPAINEVVDPIRAVENYKRENKFLKDELALHDALISRSGVSYEPLSEQQLYEVENQCRRFIDGNLDELPIQNIRQVQGSLIDPIREATFTSRGLRQFTRATGEETACESLSLTSWQTNSTLETHYCPSTDFVRSIYSLEFSFASAVYNALRNICR